MSEQSPADESVKRVQSVFGAPSNIQELADIALKVDFAPWHHPVKQIVRDHQWRKLTDDLFDSYGESQPDMFRYFTLPGKDLLDVHTLAPVCQRRGMKIEYFGFDSDPSRADSAIAESALLQAGVIAPDALVMTDKLEEIARNGSPAATQLQQRKHFNVINVDACAHLAYRPTEQGESTFDAIHALLVHQLKAERSWLLFITTRVEPSLLEGPGSKFKHAISENLRVNLNGFAEQLAAAIEADPNSLDSDLQQIWSTPGHNFLKLYTIGLGKFLLQFYNAQQNLVTKVELASAYAYRVYGDVPDMLALAFRIIPERTQALPPSVGGTSPTPDLEPAGAVRLAKKAAKLADLDDALRNEPETRRSAVTGTVRLLSNANYSIPDWRTWLADHPYRPMAVNESETTLVN